MGGDQKVTEKLTQVLKDLELGLRDAEKFDEGNSSAGVRVRKKAQEVIKGLKELRLLVSSVKDERAAAEKAVVVENGSN